MKFTDYPKDLQRIVELTPEGISKPFETVRIDRDGEVCFAPYYRMDFRPKDVVPEAFTPDYTFGSGSGLVGVERSCQEYEQCRAQWLAEKSEVNWRDTLEVRPVELQYDPDDVAFKSEEKTMKTVGDAWNGDGLPPVGTVCEAAFEFIDDEAVGNDNVIEVMYVDQSTVVGRIIRGSHSHSFSNGFEVGLYKFRPLQSERDKFIAACEHAIENETGEPANSTHIGIIFDANLGSLPQCKN